MLGLGFINPKARTGIYRAVESLFNTIVDQQSVELVATTLNQTSQIWDSISTRLYFEQFSDKDNILFEHYTSQFHLDFIYEIAIKTQKILIQKYINNNSLFYKGSLAIRIPFDYIAKIDVALQKTSQLFDVYHSPHHPLPDRDLIGNIPRILTIYDLIPRIHPEWMTKGKVHLFDTILQSLDVDRDWVICNSEFTKQDILRLFNIKAERIFVIPLAAANHFNFVSKREIINSVLCRYGIPNKPYFLSLSTLEPRKNLAFLINCFGRLLAEMPGLDFNLVLVGVNGWKNTDIFHAIQKIPELQSRVIFTGYIPDVDLSAIYSGATAFIYPSLYEGFGLPPLEAMQCGVPVISSIASSLPEVVGNAGLMIDPLDQDALCQALLTVGSDSLLRSKLSQLSLDRARKFSWLYCAEQTVQVYRTVVDAS
ncbi:glycosyltransferase family 4 protein [Altericista sp. CCNU0014]|uniref:glycosyltransferase family 4 protein n=1 Tax=Altericista sp. CCNU0014 TaxID=3082949 RepID=UPI00384CF6CB